MIIDELTKSIYQGDLGGFCKLIQNKSLENAYETGDWDFTYRVEKFFKDITRRIQSPSYLEMLLCDLYGIRNSYEYLGEKIGVAMDTDWEEFRDLL